MDFSTITFLFFLLPLSLLAYFLVPKRMKNAVLVLVSLLFFSWGVPEYLLLLLLSLAFHYFTALELEAHLQKGHHRRAKTVLTASVVLNLLLLGFFKYYGFLAESLNSLLGTSLRARTLPAPIGLSFYTFTVLSYLFDVYRGRASAAKNPLKFALYATFFPKLVSGPIVQYADIERQLDDHPFSWELFGSGARLFLIGLGKKVLLADLLGLTFYAVNDLALADVTFVTAWVGTLSYALMLYFDFGGYSDMAIGLSQLFGFRIGKNFDYPYLSDSITDFWRRWHISLGAWFRDYVYIPLGGSREGRRKTVRNLLIVWCLTGIWHGAGRNFIAWGLYYGILLVLEKFVLRDWTERLPKALKHILTLLAVCVGWVFFFSDSLGRAFAWFGRMLGLGGFSNATAWYYLGSSWLVLLIAAFAATPMGAAVGNGLLRKKRAWKPLSVVFFGAVFLLCIACMMNDTYTTFLYAQF